MTDVYSLKLEGNQSFFSRNLKPMHLELICDLHKYVQEEDEQVGKTQIEKARVEDKRIANLQHQIRTNTIEAMRWLDRVKEQIKDFFAGHKLRDAMLLLCDIKRLEIAISNCLLSENTARELVSTNAEDYKHSISFIALGKTISSEKNDENRAIYVADDRFFFIELIQLKVEKLKQLAGKKNEDKITFNMKNKSIIEPPDENKYLFLLSPFFRLEIAFPQIKIDAKQNVMLEHCTKPGALRI